MLRTLIATVLAIFFAGIAYAETPRFEEYPTAVTTEKLAEPVVVKGTIAWDYRNDIEKAAKEGVNFGGRYTIATWGCGSPCKSGAIIDRTTGQIYMLPEGGAVSGYKFLKNSNLLVVNADEPSIFARFPGLSREYYRFDADTGFTLIGSEEI